MNMTRRPGLRLVDPRLINGPGFRALRRERHVHEQYDIAALGENLGGILPLILLVRKALFGIRAVREPDCRITLALRVAARPADIVGCLTIVASTPHPKIVV